MTMHLVRGMTTINTKKRKRHITKAKMERWEKERRAYNKDMKRLGMHSHQMTMKEYIDYVHGSYKSKSKPSVVQTPWHQSGNEFQRNTDHIPSAISENSFAPATKKTPMQYTGERRLVGIATMHKSNMVPVFADDDDASGRKQATEIATMRRN